MTTSPIHFDDTWMETFTKLRMTAFGEAVIDIVNNADYDKWTFPQKIAFALHKEVAARAERRYIKLLKASQSPNPHVCVEDLDYRTNRNLNRELTTRLAHMYCTYRKQVQPMNQIRTCDLLVLDNFLNTPTNEEAESDLFNILAGREGRGFPMATPSSRRKSGLYPCATKSSRNQ